MSIITFTIAGSLLLTCDLIYLVLLFPDEQPSLRAAFSALFTVSWPERQEPKLEPPKQPSHELLVTGPGVTSLRDITLAERQRLANLGGDWSDSSSDRAAYRCTDRRQVSAGGLLKRRASRGEPAVNRIDEQQRQVLRRQWLAYCVALDKLLLYGSVAWNLSVPLVLFYLVPGLHQN